VDGVVAAYANAMFFAPTFVGAGQGGNSFDEFQALRAASFHAEIAARAFVSVDDRHPFEFHRERSASSCVSDEREWLRSVHLTMMTPFIQGCGEQA
jgi:hypothetical protein